MYRKVDQDNFTTVKDENNQPKVSIVTSVYGRYKILFLIIYLIPVLWVLTNRLTCVKSLSFKSKKKIFLYIISLIAKLKNDPSETAVVGNK